MHHFRFKLNGKWMLALAGITLLSCSHREVEGPRGFIPIAAIAGGRNPQQQELVELMKSHHIPIQVEGTSVYDIWVPKGDARYAIEVLRTNHLVSEGHVWFLKSVH